MLLWVFINYVLYIATAPASFKLFLSISLQSILKIYWGWD